MGDKKASSNGSSQQEVSTQAILQIPKNRDFTIVAMGGSAGSLDAIQQFIKEIPADSNMAFVIIQHLDPLQDSLLPTLLQYATRIPVLEIQDGMKAAPNHIYVIPKNKELSILNGTLLLLEPTKPIGFRMPIDSFFQSLAEDWGEKAVCIIFSGLGSDGELGARFIKAGFGLVMVQDPVTALYDSMPRSAIQTSLVDFIESPEGMAQKLLTYVQQPQKGLQEKDASSDSKLTNAMQKIFLLLRTKTGHDFSMYKKNTLLRRFERRMHIHQIQDLQEYVRLLQDNPVELETLFKELLIGVTKFFRDQQAFDSLEKQLPAIITNKVANEVVRVWVAGCSTGEEAYSIAILLQECVYKLKLKKPVKIQIYATDLDPHAIKRARAGLYMSNIAADVSPERLERWFIRKDDQYQIVQEIRELVVFAEHNLTKDASFIKLDLLTCRNVLIYFTQELQRKLLPLFHYTLRQDGILFLGPSETISGFEDLFSNIDVRWKIYKRRETSVTLNKAIDFTAQSPALPKPPSHQLPKRNEENKQLPLRDLINSILLEEHTPPAVVINTKGDIIYINGRTGKFLELHTGQPVMNVFNLAREGLSLELRSAVIRTNARKVKVEIPELKVTTNGNPLKVKITVQPFEKPEALKDFLLVVFEELPLSSDKRSPRKTAAQPSDKDYLIEELEKELREAREHLQQTIEGMETSLEELKSTNEELQSTNEELQSTNEELQSSNEEANTAKEEMQALNEELMTVNMEFRAKTEQMVEINNDMMNLLNSTEVATLFVTNDLKVKQFTPKVTKVVNLIQSDIGRSITHIRSNLKSDDLAYQVKEVVDRLIPKEWQEQAKSGQWYTIRITPYRTIDNFIDGAVISFIEITALKQTEQELKAALSYAEGIINTVHNPLLVLDNKLRIISLNPAFTKKFGIQADQATGSLFYQLNKGQWNVPQLRELLEAMLPSHTEIYDYVVEHPLRGNTKKNMLINARLLKQENSDKELILLSIDEVNE